MARVLVVEDDPFIRGVYDKALNKAGFEVEIAENGQDGLDKAKADEPDVILLDMLMPEMDGLEFLRQYELKEKHPGVKVIVFSNMSLPEKVDEAVALGAVNYKTKAMFTPNEMIQLIRDTLKG